MSDFDDEPTEDSEATEEPAAAKPAKKPRPQPAPDDDWDDDWDDDDDGGSRGGKRDLTLVYAIVAAAIVIVLAVVLTRPKDDNNSGTNAGNGGNGASTTQVEAPSKNWQGPVGDAVGQDGKDAQARAESGAGVYIWTDFGGWHLRNNGDQEVVVKVAADQVRTGGEDGDFQDQVDVTLAAGNGSEGADLDLGSSESATFTVTVDGTNVPADQIFLGGAEGVADQNPVSFVKS